MPLPWLIHAFCWALISDSKSVTRHAPAHGCFHKLLPQISWSLILQSSSFQALINQIFVVTLGYFSFHMWVSACSVVSHSLQPMNCSPPGSCVHGFPRQEYWSGLPFPTLRGLPNPRIEPTSLVSPASAGGFFAAEPPGKPSPSIHAGWADTSLKSLLGGFPFTLSFRAIPGWNCKRAAYFQFTLTKRANPSMNQCDLLPSTSDGHRGLVGGGHREGLTSGWPESWT